MKVISGYFMALAVMQFWAVNSEWKFLWFSLSGRMAYALDILMILLYGSASVGLWHLRTWGQRLAVGLYLFSLVRGLPALLSEFKGFELLLAIAIWGLLEAGIDLLALWFLVKRKSAFVNARIASRACPQCAQSLSYWRNVFRRRFPCPQCGAALGFRLSSTYRFLMGLILLFAVVQFIILLVWGASDVLDSYRTAMWICMYATFWYGMRTTTCVLRDQERTT